MKLTKEELQAILDAHEIVHKTNMEEIERLKKENEELKGEVEYLNDFLKETKG